MKEDYAWVGPSKCDEHRLAREKDLENIWNDLVSARSYTETYPLFASAIDLFRETLSCYSDNRKFCSTLWAKM